MQEAKRVRKQAESKHFENGREIMAKVAPYLFYALLVKREISPEELSGNPAASPDGSGRTRHRPAGNCRVANAGHLSVIPEINIS